MNLFDILIVTILGFCLIRGLFRGLVLELSSIIGVLAGIYAAGTYYPAAARILSRWITDTAYLNILSMLLIFIVIFIGVGLLGRLIRLLLKIAFMGWLDRLSGAGFGALKGCLIASVLLLAFTTFLPAGSSIIQNSQLSPYLSVISGGIAKLVSPNMNQSFTQNINGVKKVWDNRK